MKAELDILRLLAEADVDVEKGRVASIDYTFTHIRKNLNARK